jgi:hypothetical protein
VYVGFATSGGTGGIRALDVGSGRTLWTRTLPLPVAVSPVYVPGNDRVYTAIEGRVFALNAANGKTVVAAGKALVAIRRRQVARHREWMIRAFAIALAVSTVRIVGPSLDLLLTPAGFRLPEIFVLSLWTGWTITVGAAELWIRYTRPDRLTP